MVAGQPIQTQPQSKAWDEGFDRTFGERKAERGRFVYRRDPNSGEMRAVRVDEDWNDAPRSTGDLGKFQYNNLRATDGTDISSRTKRRDYMRAKGLADASDFTEHWQKKAKERESILSGEADTKERREIIGRALHEARSKRR